MNGRPSLGSFTLSPEPCGCPIAIVALSSIDLPRCCRASSNRSLARKTIRATSTAFRLLLRQAVVGDFQPAAGVDKTASPILVFLRHASGLDLFEGLALGDGLFDQADALDEHVAKLLQVLHVAERAVARNDFRVGGDLLEHGLDRLEITAHVPAAAKVDEREPAVEELVAHVDHIGAGEIDDAVAVRVPGTVVK